MTPASVLLTCYRENKGFSQKTAANKLGCSQSFMSAIETGDSSIPKNGFVDKLVVAYQLNEAEKFALDEAIEFSNLSFSLPEGISANLVWLFNAMFKELSNLSENQTEMISLVLKMDSKTNQIPLTTNSVN